MLKSPKKEAPKADDDARKQRKKLAKREAELMLKVDQAKKDLRKAEQRLTRARTGLETAQSALQNTEMELAELRAPAQEAAPAESGSAQPETQEANSDRDRGEPQSPDKEHVAGPPPVEGRVDISEGQQQDADTVVGNGSSASDGKTAKAAKKEPTQAASTDMVEEKETPEAMPETPTPRTRRRTR